MRHLIESGLIPNQGTFASRLQQFRQIASPILENPIHSFEWKVGNTPSFAYAAKVGEDWVVVFVAETGPWAGKVVSSVVADAEQVVKWGLK